MDAVNLGVLNSDEKAQLNPKRVLSTGGKILIGITGGVGIGLSILCLPFVTPALRKVCLPYVPATTVQIENVLAGLKNCNGKLLDIGSGDGRIVIAAAKNGFTADGVELNPWLVQYSRINSFYNKVNTNTAFYRCDLWKFNLQPYNSIVIFGVEEMMSQLEAKIQKEAQDGVIIVACRFPFSTMEPEEVIGHGVDTVWRYRLQK